jgi:hypothetical protein
MKIQFLLGLILIQALSACQAPSGTYGSDEAVRRIEKCMCYRSAEGQQLKPWELAWNEPEILRKQFSHCVCEAHIDLKSVVNPARYVVPGTMVK